MAPRLWAFSQAKHLLGEVAQPVAGGLGADQGAVEGQALAGEGAGVVIAVDAAEMAEEVADLPGAHADIPGGNVLEVADVVAQLGHEALAKAHDLPVALALGVEVGAALGSAHGQARKAVFEDLLKAQKFENGQIHRRMEPQSPLEGADGGVELDPVAPVDVDLPLVVHPGHPEGDHPLRLHEGLNDPPLLILRVAVDDTIQALQHLQHRLVELLLIRVPPQHLAVYVLQIGAFQHVSSPPIWSPYRVYTVSNDYYLLHYWKRPAGNNGKNGQNLLNRAGISCHNAEIMEKSIT